jgi:hypothetical protein
MSRGACPRAKRRSPAEPHFDDGIRGQRLTLPLRPARRWDKPRGSSKFSIWRIDREADFVVNGRWNWYA